MKADATFPASRSRAVLAFIVLLGGSCTSYARSVPLAAIPDQPAPERRFAIWTRGGRYELHAVRSTPDTLSGVRWIHHPTCDSCRVSIPRAEVDSIRTGVYDGGKTGVMMILLLPVVFGLALITRGGGA